MTVTITDNEFTQLRDFIEKQCGIALESGKAYLVESRLTQLLLELGYTNYADLLENAQKGLNGVNRPIVDKIVDAMTTNETYWFRDNSPYVALTEVLIPQFSKLLNSREKSKIRIWSAACSTGQEPYSIAMLLHEYARKHNTPHLIQKVEIVATDISPSALMLAKNGRYNGISMSRGIEPDMRDRYFTEQGSVAIIKPEIKSMVTLKRFNLQDSFLTMGHFDLIFMRNVAIYFSRDFKKDLYKKVADALNPGGNFFLGSSEFLMDGQEYFNRRSHGRCTYYEVKK